MSVDVSRATVQEIPLAQLHLHPANPRQDVGDLTDLVASIKDVGILAPLVVVPNGKGWYVVDGSRRLAAAKKAGLATARAIVHDLTQENAAAAAIIANIQRTDLTPLEEARAYREWLTLTGKTQKELAEKVGRAPSTIANALRLLDAPKPVQKAIEEGTLTAAHGRVMLELKEPGLAEKVLKEAAQRSRRGYGADGHVTVVDLKMLVDHENLEYEQEGPPAQERVRKFFEAAKAKHPKSTITWKTERHDDLLAKALGKSPATPLGYVWDEKRHTKACDCDAYEIKLEYSYSSGEDRRVPKLARTCIKPKGWAKFNPHGRTYDRRSKPKTREQREKEIAEEAAKKVTLSLGRWNRFNGPDKLEKLVYDKIAKHRDVERIVLFALVDNDYNAATTLHTWNAIKGLTQAKVRELIRTHALSQVIHSKGGYGSPYIDRGVEAILAHFKIEPKALGYKTTAEKHADAAKKGAAKRKKAKR